MTPLEDTIWPRLGAHVRARRHLRGDGSAVVLHAGEQAIELGEREWAVVAALDGTRDLEGIRRAAAARGVRVAPSHVAAFVGQLDRLGFLSDEEAAGGATESALPRDLPIVPLPGWGYACDGGGTCCRTFSTILFTPLEAAVARATLPAHHGCGQDPTALFTPEHGLDETLLAGALEDGACTFLGTDGGCRLHAAGGPGHKPLGCRVFPLRFLDVGEAIRVVPRPECACVFRPSEARPLEAARGAELDPATWVPRLGPTRLGEREVAPEALLAFLDALPPPDEDGAATLEGLAAALLADGLDARPRPSPRPDPAAMAALQDRAGRLADRRRALHVPNDFVRRAADWMATATPSAADPPAPGEALAVRVLLFAPPPGEDLPSALRAAATRIRLARALPEEALADPAVEAPIGVVEALARGYGLD